jgi:hypothetical protein
MIRSFIYVDQYKLFSLSSQLQGGLVNSRLLVERALGSKGATQKGPFTSGETLTDENATEKRTEELWSLHDYAYNQFETLLGEKNLITEISGPVTATDAVPLGGVLKVTGSALINDVKVTTDFMDQYNRFGEALNYVTNFNDQSAKLGPLKAALEKAQYKKEKERITAEIKKVMKAARTLAMDQEFIDHVSYVLRQTMGDQLELQIRPGTDKAHVSFTSILDRRYLRETDQSIVKKYSRRAQMNFTVLGIVTQRGPSEDLAIDESENKEGEDNSPESETQMRDSMLELALRLANVEKAFTGTRPNEIVVDPIAVYRQL